MVGVTSEQGLAICGPREGVALGSSGLGGDVGKLGAELVDDRLGLEVKDLDARGCGGAEPVSTRRVSCAC